MGKRVKVKLEPPDIWLLGTVLTLVGLGVLIVFDASYKKTVDAQWANHDTWYLARRQIVFALAGLAAAYLVSRMKLATFLKLTLPLLLISMCLLVAVLVCGVAKNGACRWFQFGPLSFQPSELAKMAIVMYLAGVLAQRKHMVRRMGSRWFAPIAIVCSSAFLVFVEPDLGTSLVIIGTAYLMFYAAGAMKRHLFAAGVFGTCVVCAAIIVEPYRLERIRTWLDPWRDPYGEGYQIIHSLIAHGTGGVLGIGLCEGREKAYLPAASTDFIWSTIAEEAGLIGGLIVLALFLLFVYRGLDVARRCKSSYGNLLAAGVTSLVGMQALINIAVASSAIPATGVPLPLISYGGSSLAFTLMSIGILLAVSRQTHVEMDDKELYENSYHGWRDGRSYLSGDQHRSGSSGSRSRRRTPVHR